MKNYEFISKFEQTIADYAGAKYGVAVNSCSNALFLSLLYVRCYKNDWQDKQEIPLRTYASVPMAILNAGFDIMFKDIKWNGVYPIGNLPIIDGAQRFTKDMYIPNTFHCISFQQKKILKLGHGGMILTDNEEAAKKLRRMAFDGRDYSLNIAKDDITCMGYHMNTTPEEAATGLVKFNELPNINDDSGGSYTYVPLSNFTIFRGVQINE